VIERKDESATVWPWKEKGWIGTVAFVGSIVALLVFVGVTCSRLRRTRIQAVEEEVEEIAEIILP
jgi:hypothetical protein